MPAPHHLNESGEGRCQCRLQVQTVGAAGSPSDRQAGKRGSHWLFSGKDCWAMVADEKGKGHSSRSKGLPLVCQPDWGEPCIGRGRCASREQSRRHSYGLHCLRFFYITLGVAVVLQGSLRRRVCVSEGGGQGFSGSLDSDFSALL